MNRFRYGADPWCIAAVAIYVINRWVLIPAGAPAFFRWHLNDLLLVPAALPWILWVQRKLRLRLNDAPPSWAEIALHLGVWTLICEVIGPFLLHHGTADWIDALAYGVGAIVVGCWWNRA